MSDTTTEWNASHATIERVMQSNKGPTRAHVAMRSSVVYD